MLLGYILPYTYTTIFSQTNHFVPFSRTKILTKRRNYKNFQKIHLYHMVLWLDARQKINQSCSNKPTRHMAGMIVTSATCGSGSLHTLLNACVADTSKHSYVMSGVFPQTPRALISAIWQKKWAWPCPHPLCCSEFSVTKPPTTESLD